MCTAGSSLPAPLPRAAGFTLLELLVVISLAAMLLAVAPPMLSKALPGVQLQEATRTLAAALRHTRDVAIRERASRRLAIDLTERRFQVPGRTGTQAVPAGIDLELLTVATELGGGGARGGIRFFPDGSSTGGRVTLSHGSRQYFVDVDWLTGRVSVFP